MRLDAKQLARYGNRGVLVATASADEARRLSTALRARGVGEELIVGWSNLLVTGVVDELLHVIPLVEIDTHVAPASNLHSIEVVYDGEDLQAVSVATGLSVDEVVRRHAAVEYTTECLGFTRGFPYLSGLDPSLWLDRLATPRRRVQAGSVAMAGEQVGIYPMESPGGWHLLGRTTALIFDPEKRPPSLLQPGDRVRFVPC